MDTLKSIFHSQSGGIWWDDNGTQNASKVAVGAVEERGAGFQDDVIFRAAEKWGLDVRLDTNGQGGLASMFSLSDPNSNSQGNAQNTVVEWSLGGSGSGLQLSGAGLAASDSNAMVFDFFGDGATTTMSDNLIDLTATNNTPQPVAASTTPAVPSSTGVGTVTTVSSYSLPNWSELVAKAKSFQREVSLEQLQREWTTRRPRLAAMVLKKAKVVRLL